MNRKALRSAVATAGALSISVVGLATTNAAVADVSGANDADSKVSTRSTTQADVTVEDIEAIVPEKVRDAAKIAEGLANLNAAMNEAGITTPERKAAFIATIAHESNVEYDRREEGDTRPYGGRGFIQLTGDFNYGPAGEYLGIDLLGDPDLAMSIDWSPKIATWYWTVAHDINTMADNLDMGAVNAAIGYPVGDGTEDAARCDVANRALVHFGGSGTFACTRPAIAGMPDPSTVGPAEFAPYEKQLLKASERQAR